MNELSARSFRAEVDHEIEAASLVVATPPVERALLFYRCPSCGALEHTDASEPGACQLCAGLVALVPL